MSGRTCDGTLTWRYDSHAKQFVKDGRIEGPPDAGDRYVYKLVNQCLDGSNCQAAHTCGSAGRRWTATGSVIHPDGSIDPISTRIDTVCVYPEQVVPASDVTARAHTEIERLIQTPVVTSAPTGTTLVNIITIYSTQPQPEPRIDITTPVPGRIVAVPDYQWDFGDGLTGVGPGLAYQEPDDPNALPGKYVGPVWRTPGLKHVVLTVTWRVQFLLEGVLDVPLAPIVHTTTEDKQVATARAVLVQR